MSARVLLAELDAAGISITRDGDDLRVRGKPGVSLAPYVGRIRDHKPALIAELLQVRIVAIVTVPPARFDRAEYDQLWSQLYGLENAS